MVGISWQLLTQNIDFLLGTGVLPDTAWGVPGFGGLEALARAMFRSTVWASKRARACCLAVQSPRSLADSAHGRAAWHGQERASLWRSEAIEARAYFNGTGQSSIFSARAWACGSARAGACVLWIFTYLPCIWHGRAS
ncbi:hypothetical protein JCGZ_04564 [Jatropha curcas]|uniref:Uncharacterized protein n=1 Tax=Jatropha curcas TaxID=180498 RepID=A0A067LP21_JATCU|nr:hypothetical protein JCGZ_04564 [Jatropha curcas]